ncbi:uncharacterized protein B0I36DRAFT_56008 [Microdochium trichocladiopsis]|uniref:Uncharacterized protein n=1 Tax=Microdochium trichocladiopsis TaxID=1682393 RepID=A0A9P8XT55_9PEZI|nr:uncharacterized protein B0I36DRAFT_56008 [Microdochium trichocladiopsis]KAH7010814.1 hypothetical protein B0I36DRAFT_56008 [Microdochium trichocladiopsis]
MVACPPHRRVRSIVVSVGVAHSYSPSTFHGTVCSRLRRLVDHQLHGKTMGKHHLAAKTTSRAGHRTARRRSASSPLASPSMAPTRQARGPSNRRTAHHWRSMQGSSRVQPLPHCAGLRLPGDNIPVGGLGGVVSKFESKTLAGLDEHGDHIRIARSHITRGASPALLVFPAWSLSPVSQVIITFVSL